MKHNKDATQRLARRARPIAGWVAAGAFVVFVAGFFLPEWFQETWQI